MMEASRGNKKAEAIALTFSVIAALLFTICQASDFNGVRIARQYGALRPSLGGNGNYNYNGGNDYGRRPYGGSRPTYGGGEYGRQYGQYSGQYGSNQYGSDYGGGDYGSSGIGFGPGGYNTGVTGGLTYGSGGGGYG